MIYLCRQDDVHGTSNVHAPWMTTEDGHKKERNRKHQASRTNSAVGTRSPPTRISVLVDDRRAMDEVGLRLGVRHQPLVDEGRQVRDRQHRGRLRELHDPGASSVVFLSWTWRPGVRGLVPPDNDVSTSMWVKWLLTFSAPMPISQDCC